MINHPSILAYQHGCRCRLCRDIANERRRRYRLEAKIREGRVDDWVILERAGLRFDDAYQLAGS